MKAIVNLLAVSVIETLKSRFDGTRPVETRYSEVLYGGRGKCINSH